MHCTPKLTLSFPKQDEIKQRRKTPRAGHGYKRSRESQHANEHYKSYDIARFSVALSSACINDYFLLLHRTLDGNVR